MKTLKNGFTTPGQSKQLLELGVPAWTADMYHWSREGHHNRLWWGIEYQRHDEPKNFDATDIYGFHLYYPCWSVGRLIEIYLIARGVDITYLQIDRGEDMIEYIIRLYKEHSEKLDFSKLED